MNVQQIHDRIIDISIDEDAADGTLSAYVLDSINAVYREVYQECCDESHNYNLAVQTVTLDANGEGALSPVPYRILLVKHNQTNTILEPTDWQATIIDDPAESSSGGSNRYYLKSSFGTIVPFPAAAQNETLKVMYIPRPLDLTLASAEADIKIPPIHHDIFVWGGLYYLSLYERGFTSPQIAGMSLNEYSLRKKSLLSDLLSNSRQTQVVQTYGM